MFQYQAIVQKVVDGDTMEIDIDLGLSIWVKSEKIRLYGINTPEVFGIKKGTPEWESGNKASNFVKKYVKAGDEIIVETHKDKKEKYGRYLALVFIQMDESIVANMADIRKIGNFYCLNDILVAKGLARKYMI